MIDKQAFARMREEMEKFDAQREKLIKQSRDVLKLSKKAIYSLHRNDVVQAKKQLRQASAQNKKLHSLASKDCRLATTGAYSEALEEFVEARCFLNYLTNKKLPTPKQLKVDTEVFLGGVCDLVGELVRRAINAAAEGDEKTPFEIKETVSAIYGEMMLFDFRNIPLRKKFDSIKYGLEKLETLALDLILKRSRR